MSTSRFTPSPIRKLKKSLAPACILTPDRPGHSAVAIPTILLRAEEGGWGGATTQLSDSNIIVPNFVTLDYITTGAGTALLNNFKIVSIVNRHGRAV